MLYWDSLTGVLQPKEALFDVELAYDVFQGLRPKYTDCMKVSTLRDLVNLLWNLDDR